MPLTILNVAYPFARVGPDAVGGAEQVLALLDEALVAAGHRSIVVAAEGSRCRGTLLATPLPGGTIDEPARARTYEAQRAAIWRALRQWPIDLVHLHGIDFHQYLPPPGPPALATLHLPPDWYPAEIYRPTRPRTYLSCVSRSQRAACPPSEALVAVVPNGVRLEVFQPSHARGAYALALGRICPEKGFHLALAAAIRAGVPLILAGQVFAYEAHQRYFHEQIVPLLDDQRRFVGPLDLERKRALLAGARCLLVPSLVAETSSLVAMEALACGTPVVAYPAGALPEIVEHGRTGLLVESVEAMAEAIARSAALDPDACRQAAEQRYSAQRTQERYLALYTELAAQRGHSAATVGIASSANGNAGRPASGRRPADP